MNETKEADVFNKYGKLNNFRTIIIWLLIFVVSTTTFYFFVKAILTYTVTYNLNGGYVYESGKTKEEMIEKGIAPVKLRFLQRIEEPVGIKNEDNYIDYWSTNPNLNNKFKFGTKIWRSTNLYIKWEKGVAVRLHFYPGEENRGLSEADLKGLYEWYVKPGSDYTLPLIYAETNNAYNGEQLLWFDNPECEGEPFDTKTYKNLTESVDIYGKWFDTKAEKFQVDESNTLQKYTGYCKRVILPDGITKIKDIEIGKFNDNTSDVLGDQPGTYKSVWQNVMSIGPNNLEVVYLNAEMRELGNYAFAGCQALKELKFTADNVERIGAYAFWDCRALCGLTFPSKVTIVETNTFNGTFDYKQNVSLYLPNVTMIEDQGFINCNMQKIELDKVEYIGKGSFAGCNFIKEIKINSENPPTSNVTGEKMYWNNVNNRYELNVEGLLYGADNECKIYVPTALVPGYTSLNYWSWYSDKFIGY